MTRSRFLGRRLGGVVALLSAAIFLGACEKPQSMGDANALIVAVPDGVWAGIRGDVEAALEPRAFTVRDERIFRATQIDPTDPQWSNLRRFRQILVIGEPADPWVAEALEQARQPITSYPGITEAHNVWARGQRVFVAVVPPGSDASEVLPLLPQVGETALAQYRNFIQQRMYVSGIDSVRADTLRQKGGFSLLLPRVYAGAEIEPGVFMFQNENPDRTVLVTARPAGEVPLTQEAALTWRDAAAERYYRPRQVSERERLEVTNLEIDGARAIQVQGIWTAAPGEWPAAGPFITRLVECPDGRTFLTDSWVFSPGRELYEFVYQMNTILNTFSCADQRAG